MTIRDRFEHTVTLLSGMVIGATVMYIFDEHRGARRRAQARDRVIHAGRVMGRHLRKSSRDVVNRALGSVAELRSSIRDRVGEIPDDQLVDRVRSQLGHVVSHSGLLRVEARDGCITVSGSVLPSEVEKIRHRVARTRGVKECRLQVEPRADLERVAGRAGGSSRRAI